MRIWSPIGIERVCLHGLRFPRCARKPESTDTCTTTPGSTKMFAAAFFAFLLALVCSGCSAGKTLLVGGTGRVGRAIASRLSRDMDTTVLVRDLAKAKAIQELVGCRLVEGDVTDLKSLQRACVCKLFDRVIAVHGAKPPRFSKLMDIFGYQCDDKSHPANVNLGGVKNLLEVLDKKGKFVRLTGALVGKANSPFCVLFNLLLSFTVKYHELSELAIRQHGCEYLIVRPTGIRDEPKALDTLPAGARHLVCISPQDKERKIKLPGKISVGDVAELCVLNLPPSLSRTTILISSEQGPGPVTWDGALTAGGVSSSDPPNSLRPGPHTRNALLLLATFSSLCLSIVNLSVRFFTKKISSMLLF